MAPVGDPVADQIAHAEAKVEAKTLVVDAGIEEALQRAKERVLQQPLQLPEAGLRTPMPSGNQREVRPSTDVRERLELVGALSVSHKTCFQLLVLFEEAAS